MVKRKSFPILLAALIALSSCSSDRNSGTVTSTPEPVYGYVVEEYDANGNLISSTTAPRLPYILNQEIAADGSIVSAQLISMDGDRISITDIAHPNGSVYDDGFTLAYHFDGITYTIDCENPSNVTTTFEIGPSTYAIGERDGSVVLINQDDSSVQTVAALPADATYSPIHIFGLDDYAILISVAPPKGAEYSDVPDSLYVYVLQGEDWVQAEFLYPDGEVSTAVQAHARRKFVKVEDFITPRPAEEDIEKDDTIGQLEICQPDADGGTATLYGVTYSNGKLQLEAVSVYPDGIPETWKF